MNYKCVWLSNQEKICTYSINMVRLLTSCCYEYLYECIHPMSSFYTCTHVCIRNILCHIHASRVRGDNIAGVQWRRGRGPVGDSSSRSSRRRGAEPRRASGVPWSPPHFLSKRQAPEHSKSPSILQNINWVLMIDALGIRVVWKHLMHGTALSRYIHL